MDKISRLQAFRQDLYHRVFTRRRDAQQEVLDALLLSPALHTLPEISLTTAMQRQWHSLYKALEQGTIDTTALHTLLVRQLSHEQADRPIRCFVLDESAWPRRDAVTLEDRTFVHCGSAAADRAGVVIGHSYSVLGYCTEAGGSWVLPMSAQRVATRQDTIQVGLDQVRLLLDELAPAEPDRLNLIIGDGRYGNHLFLGPLRPDVQTGRCAVLVRMRADRVLYRAPETYSGRGRPRKHGSAFRFKEPETWPSPEMTASLTDARYGQVALELWSGLHAEHDAETVFSVLRVRVQLEQEGRPPEERSRSAGKPLWLAWLGPRQTPEEIWRYYRLRMGLEASFRFRKQYLHWTLPRLHTVGACERWTQLVSMAQWVLYLSRGVVEQRPHPWQRLQRDLTPERLKQSWGGLFGRIGTPARLPKPRGKSPGWPTGRPRRRRERQEVLRRGQKAALS